MSSALIAKVYCVKWIGYQAPITYSSCATRVVLQHLNRKLAGSGVRSSITSITPV
ncbi:hypothetical protein OI25_7036 [Paraburkholderia fungorum]|jgi:hypothetical protein|uniref:Transposase n=1 Tax=Paraburkholderia fungorum TaxID=134537 RepID=A0AAW3VA33_9BURK|nr:hypothetical protein OI25_7036 [Paraburkholderia fungorum]MDI7066028.1 hypothetical protein [Klebsiella pneumoniae]MBB4519270.1 hypothetical protein [Paraburkholderia fungorum]MBB5546082.1 hypothetical protein [Paraburkholderia fungorum]MBB6206236.1 hypothetical protein [Paraburkholderia fungorum]